MKKFLSISIILVLAAFFIGALAGYSTKVFMEQGGDRFWVESGGALELASGGIQNVTGEINVRSGGVLNLKSGAKLKQESGYIQDSTGKTWVRSGGEINFDSGSIQNVTGQKFIRSGGALELVSGAVVNATGKSSYKTGSEINLESGSVQNVTGTENIRSGGTLDVKSGASLIKDSSTITFRQFRGGIAGSTTEWYVSYPGLDSNDFIVAQMSTYIATPNLVAASPYVDEIHFLFDGNILTDMRINAVILQH